MELINAITLLLGIFSFTFIMSVFIGKGLKIGWGKPSKVININRTIDARSDSVDELLNIVKKEVEH